MPKKPPNQQAARGAAVQNPISQVTQQIPQLTGQQQVQLVGQFYQGPVPPAEELARYEAIQPGAADRIIKLAEGEVEHRRSLEKEMTEANIATQRKQAAIAELQAQAVFASDKNGQRFGAFLMPISNCCYGLFGNEWS